MSDRMKYEEFEAEIGYDAANDSLFGCVVNTDAKAIITFYGKSVDELHKEFAASVAVWRSVSAKHGITGEKPEQKA